jgi:PKHD-type hydroxylase
MAFQTVWYDTNLPEDIISILEKDLKVFENNFDDSVIGYGGQGEVNKGIRNSKNVWIPTTHWIGGFLWHYATRANRENFLYDLTCIDGENLQYTRYSEGEFYNWHTDSGIDVCYKPQNITTSCVNDPQDFIATNVEYVRKLSFTLQLSNFDEYTGGEVQFLDNSGKPYFMPKQKGTIAFFDSRTPHRVKKVKSGVRKSLVGWVIGPRFR